MDSDLIQDPIAAQETSMVDLQEIGIELRGGDEINIAEATAMSKASHKIVQEELKACHTDTHESGPGIFEHNPTVVDLTKMRGIGEIKKVSYSALASAIADFHQSCIELISALERFKLSRQPKKVISLPLPASIPSNNNQATPILIPDRQGQTNGSINRKPAPGVKPGIQPVDVHDEPSVPLLIEITPTPVDSRGRGSCAVEAQVSHFRDSSFALTPQNGRKRRKCCCPIM